MNHATIKLGDYTIPLIGVDRNATLEECDLCHDIFSIQAVRLEGTQILCDKCRKENKAILKEAIRNWKLSKERQ